MRTAVVLFNLGGPDKPEAVGPFLTNLFSDPAIISLPAPLRWLAARLIAARRTPRAQQIYAGMGGGSPILGHTRQQADALASALADLDEVRCFIAMRYWHPMSDETAAKVRDFGPDEVILLPLYPQFSTTTTASSFRDWDRAAVACGLDAPSRRICCFGYDTNYLRGLTRLVAKGLAEARNEAPGAKIRLLFSAHGLPERIVAAGDPYQWQVEETAAAVATALGEPELDWLVSYQSRVGPLKWIGPATDAEVIRAGGDGAALVVVPVAFVSEHAETLVELDMDYRRLAKAHHVPAYIRIPALGTDPAFVDCLAQLVRTARMSMAPVCSALDGRKCPDSLVKCVIPGLTNGIDESELRR
ncbi:MAG: ferrochelatase [Alphaproteobacteria bacterium]